MIVILIVTALDILLYGKTSHHGCIRKLVIDSTKSFLSSSPFRSWICRHEIGWNHIDIGGILLGYVPEQLARLHHQIAQVCRLLTLTFYVFNMISSLSLFFRWNFEVKIILIFLLLYFSIWCHNDFIAPSFLLLPSCHCSKHSSENVFFSFLKDLWDCFSRQSIYWQNFLLTSQANLKNKQHPKIPSPSLVWKLTWIRNLKLK